MDVANASLYDGGTALGEAVFMAGAITGKRDVVISGCVNPLRLSVLKTYLSASGFRLGITDWTHGYTDPDQVKSAVGSDTCCVILENPNFFGVIEAGHEIGDIAKASGALFIVAVDPIALGILSAPAAYGADIVVGEGQSLGNSLSYGGPYLGLMATRREFIRRLPGRIVGKTVDQAGRPCFCLTLQTREQHIRREKATSNICTNEALNALRAAVYLGWMGGDGLREVACHCLSKAVYARKALAAAGFSLRFDRPFFKEFVIDLPGRADQFFSLLLEERILAGLPMGRFYDGMDGGLLLCFTEKRTKSEIDRLVEALKTAVKTVGSKT
jgi:glycine dehydrogenase subunit 1